MSIVTPAARAEGQRLFGAFQTWGAAPVEAAVLQPAGTLLDLYGEDIRARAYVTQDPVQGEMMLRPDFTVPVVQAHMAGGADPARYCYLGEVFRKQEQGAERASEYLQVGYEVFDRDQPLRADAEVFALFARMLAGKGLRAATGDIGILIAAVRGLPTSDTRKAALMRHLWRPVRFRSLLERFAGRAPLPKGRAALLARMKAGDPVESPAPQIGLRSRAEIETRLARLAEDSATPAIPADVVDALEALVGVADKAPAALSAMRGIAAVMPWITPSLDTFEQRLTVLAAHGVDVAGLDFEASYGRTTLEYYDGFVFGFFAETRPDLPPVASGGRYDALTQVLGQGRSIPAVGGVIRPALLVELEGGQ
ncbi:ATP phosphoribosyltransferase regulatory subunit [Pararhodobacter marinus]|uniref:ATP phosphoribosyltransferase regulatory subunit n=1 Tax=Pararhodobacter marinus TaxID=2184063 RepID=A0A2U2CGF6_9RHOB|nr:ATP phosphoribosyltransferase regulatory subunit [Pararhodobacter marinus]